MFVLLILQHLGFKVGKKIVLISDPKAFIIVHGSSGFTCQELPHAGYSRRPCARENGTQLVSAVSSLMIH